MRFKLDALHLRALLWLILALTAVLACASQMTGRFPLQTNLLALLPTTERNPVAEQAVNKLAEAAGNRVVFLLGNEDAPAAFAAARAFAAQLRSTGNFRHVLADIPPLDPKQISAFFQPYRYNLLSDADRVQLANELFKQQHSLPDRLQTKLYAPFRFGLTMSAAADPFGLTDDWLASLPLKNLQLEPHNGMLVSRSNGKTWVFVSADLPDSAYNGDVQHQVATAVDMAEHVLKTHHPDTILLRAGTVFYADAARASAEQEVHRISVVSLVGMLLLLYLVFRSIRPLVLGLLSVGFGITAAIAVTLALYGEIHLITLVFGASLIGEAIDYAIQYFAAHLGAGADWEPMKGLRRIGAGLTVALITSLMGYGALALAPFPALSQIALFALVGLTSAWLSVFLLLPALLRTPNRRNPETAVALPRKILLKWQHRISAKASLLATGLLLVLAIPGWSQLKANDDVHLLIARSTDLVSQEEAIRRIIGFDNSSQFFLVEGQDTEQLLQNEEALHEKLNQLIQQETLTGYQGMASFVPSRQRQADNRSLWSNTVFADEKQLSSMLEEAGLRDEVAIEQITAFKASADNRLELASWLEQPLSTPFRHLWLGKTDQGYAAIVLPQGIKHLEHLRQATAGLPHVTFVDKAGSVSTLFEHYRQWSSLWLLGAIGLIFLVLSMRYHWQQSLIILMPTVLAMVLTLSLFGYLHIALTLFNMMGLMLVLGVGVNYAIFLREGGIHAAATLAGVLLSAGTTLLSFGMLAFSSMPALSSFGLTLLIGIAVSAFLAPMLLSFDRQLDQKA
ncbi:MMPL family transporter [Methylobacillus gramineus]|uniref:MMPL family transporter n=1 Tax=Methylobacillus gramineus TaxID=755169 RepID=UPI001CFFCE62|nr:MMPL family transporter [Methylobacillus gramineus]MCB5183728.1 MMPL family transporter [Methylobacillus gramineus]